MRIALGPEAQQTEAHCKQDSDMTQTHKRICPICEAGCSLTVQAEGRTILACRGNDDDTFSRGHVCPKGVALTQLDADRDRLRTPFIKRNGRHEPATWDEAMTEINTRLAAVRTRHGNEAVAMYIGNPTAHNVGLMMGFNVLAGAVGSRSIFSAGSVDQLPKQFASELMFGNDMAIPVPDIARCDLLLMLGANPVVSNGSLWMVPDIRGKVRALHDRGGKLIVIDPRRTETAKLADCHHFIRPGTDAWLLAALINQLRDAGRELSPRLYPHVRGCDELLASLRCVTLTEAAQRTGMSETDIAQLATQLSAARCPVAYGRVGTTLQRFGTLTSFLIEVLNVLLDSLDQRGGAMFPEQSFCSPTQPRTGLKYDRYRSRVSGYPELLGQLPVACLAEEMETPGPGQIRALITIAGNPVLSNPESERLDRALANLDFMVAIDIYHTETTRHADVILPGTSPFEDSHYDSFLGAMSWRNTARYSPALFPCQDRPDEWRMMLGLAHIAANGRVANRTELDAFEDNIVASAAHAYVADADGAIAGRDVQEVVGSIGPERGVERLLDLGIRAGTFGDAFGARANGLTLQHLIDAQDSIDLGPLRPRLAQVLRTQDGKIDLAPASILKDVQRLLSEAPAADADELLMIGRRNIQTNNSWLRNLPMLTKGPARAVLDMHPDDARTRGLGDGDLVRVSTAIANVEVVMRINADIAPGVVCLPHGFSAGQTPLQAVAQSHPGVNSNALAAANYVDVPSGTVALNGIAVRCERAAGLSR